ncbi:replication/maintenance protein RepL [Arsenophonus nasoniae]|uniref:replication/maintenance protein RepL n=1 Tax=Arsenophonus nasoniae TaxID=638 RepID=UPI0038791CED
MANRGLVTMCETTTHVNHETGEVTSESKVVKFRLPKEPPYVKLYIDDLSKIMNISDGSQKLIHHLIARLDYEGHITLNPVLRKKISEELSIKEQTFRNYLRELIIKKIIIRVANNYFKANPYLFAKGEWSEVFKQRRNFDKIIMNVTYDKKGNRSIKTDIK